MNKLLPLLCVVCMPLVGCTTSSNKISDAALDRGLVATDTVVTELAKQCRYHVGENFSHKINELIVSGGATPDRVNALLTEFANTLITVDWLAMQEHSRAREYTRMGQSYIWEQRGILSVLFEEYKTAEARALAQKEKDTPAAPE